MALANTLPKLECDKFVECDTGQTAVATKICNSLTEPIPIEFAGATEPKIYNLSAPVAATEVSQAFTAGTKKITIKVRSLKANIQYAWVVTESSTNYITIPKGCAETIDGVSLTGKTLYIQTDGTGETIEIQEFS